MNQTNAQWLRVLEEVLQNGNESAPRGKPILEILGYQTKILMSSPVMTIAERKLSYKFMCAEAAWILDGDNRVESITGFNKNIAKFSDDGVYFAGAYGPRIVDQLTYVVDTLVADPDSRQAVIEIWRPNPRSSKDVPCTISVQWFVRNGALHCVDTMRSSDIWLGWPYDVFNFSMLSAYIVLLIKHRNLGWLPNGSDNKKYETLHNLKLGTLILNAGSQHLYEENFDAARLLVSSTPLTEHPCGNVDLDNFSVVGEFGRPSISGLLWSLASSAWKNDEVLSHLF